MALNTAVTADANAPAITRAPAQFVAIHPSRGWSDAVNHEAHRTWLNRLGCAGGADQHEAVDAALAAVQMLQPAPLAQLLGRAERVDMASPALLSGIASHTFDFDDTRLKTIIHPAGPVASALLALAEVTGARGRTLIDALVSIDACAQLRAQGVAPEQVERIELRVHSLVLALTGKKDPADGLAAKFSVYHSCTTGLIFGQAGEPEIADSVVNRDDVVALRRKVVATVDASIDEAAADVTAVLRDGHRMRVLVEHDIGSLQRADIRRRAGRQVPRAGRPGAGCSTHRGPARSRQGGGWQRRPARAGCNRASLIPP